MGFFSKYFMHEEHLIALKESRKVHVKNKVINHNNNFIEFINMEQGLKVYPEKDELLDMINSIKIFDDMEILDHYLRYGVYRNYIYDDLPKKLRNYMSSMDAYFLAVSRSRTYYMPSEKDYNKRIERLEKLIPDYTDDDFQRYVALGHSIPSTIGRKAKESARRSYKTVLSLFRSNIGLFKQFATFTFALEENKEKYEMLNDNRQKDEYDLKFEYVNAKDFEVAKKAFKDCIDALRLALKRKGIPFEYIAVWELQKNGNYHFHMLCSEIPKEFQFKIPAWLDYDFRKHKVNDGYGLKHWHFGKSDIQCINSPDRITTYVSKYIIKSFLNVSELSYDEYLNKKKYFASKGLIKADSKYIVTDSEIEKIISQMSLADKVAYSDNYTNPYNNSNIEKKIYTLIES